MHVNFQRFHVFHHNAITCTAWAQQTNQASWTWESARTDTHGGAHLITHTEIEAALLIHRVVYPGKLREFGPFQLERIIQKTVVRAERHTAGLWTLLLMHCSKMLINFIKTCKSCPIHSHPVLLSSVGRKPYAAGRFNETAELQKMTKEHHKTSYMRSAIFLLQSCDALWLIWLLWSYMMHFCLQSKNSTLGICKTSSLVLVSRLRLRHFVLMINFHK